MRISRAKKATVVVSVFGAGYWLGRYLADVVGANLTLITRPDDSSDLAVEMFDTVYEMLTENADVAAIREKLFG